MIIGVCDDNEVMRNSMVKTCQKVMDQYDDEIEIITFTDGKEVLDEELDILILDIEMEDIDGITVKNTFQKKNKDTIIIFATSHDEMMIEAFGVNVIGFVTKKYMETQLPAMLDVAIKKVMSTVMVEGIDSRDICYIQAEHVYNILHTADEEEFSVRISSADLEEMLAGVDFIRVHRAYIVNMAYVDRIKEKTIVVDGNEIPISARLKGKVKHEYDLYCKKNVRFC